MSDGLSFLNQKQTNNHVEETKKNHRGSLKTETKQLKGTFFSIHRQT